METFIRCANDLEDVENLMSAKTIVVIYAPQNKNNTVVNAYFDTKRNGKFRFCI
jgi:hypothetical protein